jgi:aminopeptidase N
VKDCRHSQPPDPEEASAVPAAENLTRDEAAERAALLAVDRYDVDLDLSGAARGDITFRSVATVRFRCAQPGANTHLDLTADAARAELNGEAVPAESFDGQRLALSGLAAENVLRIDADCRYSRTGEGLHRFVDPVDDETYLYTQFETFDAHRAFGCFDQPDLKATFAFRVTAPEHWEVIANTPAGKHPAGDGLACWQFADTVRISSYITAIVAGPYHGARARHDGIDLGVYCRRSLAAYLDPDDLLALTRAGFDYYHRAFGVRYPFAKYDQCFVPEFNAGAMENAGCVTILEDYVFRSKETASAYEQRANTILHEMAHMWFGDLVTMRWWDDLWLNESFAEYMAHEAATQATRFTDSWTTFATGRKAWGYRQDQLPSTHPVASDMVDIEAVKVNFDGITYAKGASVLKQLVAWVGKDAFFAGLNPYFTEFAQANATLADLLAALERSSGRDLDAWATQWLQTAGVNTLRPEIDDAADGTMAAVRIRQSAPPDHPTLRSHRVAIGLYDRQAQGLVRRDRVELDIAGELTEVAELAGLARPELLLVNDDDLTYAKVRLDDASMSTLMHAVGEIGESLPRALCWAAAWDMTRDAELTAGDYVELVLAGAAAEGDLTTMESQLRLAQQAIVGFGDPARREQRMARLAELAREQLSQAEPGSDRQLAWARVLGAAATSAEQILAIRSVLDGTAEVAGLAVDTELRWHLLTRLAAIGEAGEAQIAAETERDNTAAGGRHAATCRAARPMQEAKAEAWQVAVEQDTTPNAVQMATIAGFAQPGQEQLLRGYVDRYFAEIRQVWARPSSEKAHNVAVGLYPNLIIEPATVEATDAFLAADDLPPALRRLVAERRDELARRLRAREADR